jgi:hypothetical protein
MVLLYRSRDLAGICLLGIVALTSCRRDGDGYVLTNRGDSGIPGDDDAGNDAADAATDGGMDGGLNLDGATMDAAALGLDATLELPPGTLILPDGAIVLPDGEVIDVDAAIDRFEREIDVSTCEIADEDIWDTQVDFSDHGGFSLKAGGKTGFGLAYRSTNANECPENVNVMRIPSSEGFEPSRALFMDCHIVRNLALLGTADGWQVTWVYNETGSAELHSLALDADMNPAEGAERVRVTDNELEQETQPVLTELDGRPLAAWFTTPPLANEDDSFPIRTRVLDGESEVNTIVDKAAAHAPQALALAATNAENAALGWVSTTENPGVWLQRLDHDGAATGDPILLNDRVGASASIDVASRAKGGGAVLYTVEFDGFPQVRFRRLSETGEPVDIERTLIGPPLRAQAASLHEIGGGYAVVYRALPGQGITEPEVRLTFVTKEGNPTRDSNGQFISFPIGPADVSDGRTSVAVSIDGAIMVAWTDADTADTSRNLLKVVRRKLTSCH